MHAVAVASIVCMNMHTHNACGKGQARDWRCRLWRMAVKCYHVSGPAPPVMSKVLWTNGGPLFCDGVRAAGGIVAGWTGLSGVIEAAVAT